MATLKQQKKRKSKNEVAIDVIKKLKSNKCIDNKAYKILEKIETCMKMNAKK